MGNDKFILVDDPKKTLLEYIDENTEWILPFSVSEGYEFKVRIKTKVYESLPKNIIKALIKSQYHEEDMFGEIQERSYYHDDEEETKRWVEEYYWTPCDAYIFHYRADGFHINCRETYSHDGTCEGYGMYFLNINNLPFIVWVNRNTRETCNDFVYPKNGKVYQ